MPTNLIGLATNVNSLSDIDLFNYLKQCSPNAIRELARNDVRNDWNHISFAKRILNTQDKNNYINNNISAAILKDKVWSSAYVDFYHVILANAGYVDPAPVRTARSVLTVIKGTNSLTSAIASAISLGANNPGEHIDKAITTASLGSSLISVLGSVSGLDFISKIGRPLGAVGATVDLANYFSRGGQDWLQMYSKVISIFGRFIPGIGSLVTSIITNFFDSLSDYKVITLAAPNNEIDEAISYSYNAKMIMFLGDKAHELAQITFDICSAGAALSLYRSIYMQHSLMQEIALNAGDASTPPTRDAMGQILTHCAYEMEFIFQEGSSRTSEMMELLTEAVNSDVSYIEFRDAYIRTYLLPPSDVMSTIQAALTTPYILPALLITVDTWRGRLSARNPNPLSIDRYYDHMAYYGTIKNQATSAYSRLSRANLYRQGDHNHFYIFNPETLNYQQSGAADLPWKINKPVTGFSELTGMGPAGEWMSLHFTGPSLDDDNRTGNIQVNPAGAWTVNISEERTISTVNKLNRIELYYYDDVNLATKTTGISLTYNDLDMDISLFPVVLNNNMPSNESSIITIQVRAIDSEGHPMEGLRISQYSNPESRYRTISGQMETDENGMVSFTYKYKESDMRRVENQHVTALGYQWGDAISNPLTLTTVLFTL